MCQVVHFFWTGQGYKGIILPAEDQFSRYSIIMQLLKCSTLQKRGCFEFTLNIKSNSYSEIIIYFSLLKISSSEEKQKRSYKHVALDLQSPFSSAFLCDSIDSNCNTNIYVNNVIMIMMLVVLVLPLVVVLVIHFMNEETHSMELGIWQELAGTYSWGLMTQLHATIGFQNFHLQKLKIKDYNCCNFFYYCAISFIIYVWNFCTYLWIKYIMWAAYVNSITLLLPLYSVTVADLALLSLIMNIVTIHCWLKNNQSSSVLFLIWFDVRTWQYISIKL